VAANKRSKIQRERDRLTIAELLLKGWSQQRIADWLDLDKSNICREVKKIKTQWQAETIENHNFYIQSALRRLAMLEAEHWAAWERAQCSKETTHLEKLLTGNDDSGAPTGKDFNLAERSLRLAVTKRKVSGGSRSMPRLAIGRRLGFVWCLPCRRQGCSAIKFFKDALIAKIGGEKPLPSLLPQPST